MSATRAVHATGADAAHERLTVRCSAAQKEQIQRAARLRGLTISEFVLHVAADAAWQTLHEHEVMVLSERDTEAFVNTLLNPPKPGPRLRRAAARYATRLNAQ